MIQGRREARKQETRAALQEAASALVLERGLAAVTAEDIAMRAGVSARTFFNYFATKDEVFAARESERGQRFLKELRAAPEDLEPWSALTRAALVAFGGLHAMPELGTELQERRELLRRNPGLVPVVVESFLRLRREVYDEVLRRAGRGRDPLAPRLLSSAAGAAIQAAVESWIADQPDESLDALLERAFAALRPR